MSRTTHRLRRWFVRTLVLGSGALRLRAQTAPALGCQDDHRCSAIRNFFLRYKSPLALYATHFLAAADQHRLDWRLLPSIAMVETSAGRYGVRGANVFGWNSGLAKFPSIEAGIQFVASRFAQSPIYAGRTAKGILMRYNPARTVYPGKVIHYMRELSPEPVE